MSNEGKMWEGEGRNLCMNGSACKNWKVAGMRSLFTAAILEVSMYARDGKRLPSMLASSVWLIDCFVKLD